MGFGDKEITIKFEGLRGTGKSYLLDKVTVFLRVLGFEVKFEPMKDEHSIKVITLPKGKNWVDWFHDHYDVI